MWRTHLAVLLWLLLAAGCCSREETTPSAGKGDAGAPTTPVPQKAGASTTPAPQKEVRTGDFGLPLEYTIEVPEVPEELLKPSPPIR